MQVYKDGHVCSFLLYMVINETPCTITHGNFRFSHSPTGFCFRQDTSPKNQLPKQLSIHEGCEHRLIRENI